MYSHEFVRVITNPLGGVEGDEMDRSEALTHIRHELLGVSLKAADKAANESGWTIRVVRINKKACVTTRDFVPNRINVAVESAGDGERMVVEVTGLG